MPSFPSLRFLAVAAIACTLGSLVSGQTVTTDPVGFITLTITPSAAAGDPQLTFRGLGLARPVEDQGIATSVANYSITASAAGWTDNLYNGVNGAYYVEIIGPAGGAGVGTTYDITATAGSAKTITLAQKLADGVAVNATFRIRKHWTIASVFGAANEGGLGAGTASSADTIAVLSALDQTYTTYFYSNQGGPGIGWRKQGGGATPQDATVLYPDDGLLITRKQTSPLNLVLMGAVKTGQTSFPVLSGLNILANPYAGAMTLASSGLYTGSATSGLAGGTATSADQVLIYNGSSYDTYYYSTRGGPGVGWRQVGGGSTDKSAIPLGVGSGFLIQRRGASGFDWVAPQHPASF